MQVIVKSRLIGWSCCHNVEKSGLCILALLINKAIRWVNIVPLTQNMFALPNEILHNHILPTVSKDAIFVCKSWYEAQFGNLLMDERIRGDAKSFFWAARENHLKVVSLLMNRMNNCGLVKGFKLAASRCRLKVVELLLQSGKFDERDIKLLMENVIKTDNIAVFKLLVPYCKSSRSLTQACILGRKKMVKIFLTSPEIDPTYKDFEAINHAAKHRHVEIVKLLLADPRINDKLSSKQIDDIRKEVASPRSDLVLL